MGLHVYDNEALRDIARLIIWGVRYSVENAGDVFSNMQQPLPFHFISNHNLRGELTALSHFSFQTEAP